MRIASLVPSATESLFALGLGDRVVAVTHECDFPAEALRPARLTRSVIPDGLEPEEIDAMVREVTGQGRGAVRARRAPLADSRPTSSSRRRSARSAPSPTTTSRAVAGRLPSSPT